MPPKKGKKRKLNAHNGHDASTNGADDLVSPNRSTWPGWVEMESEPAFFNVMLKEMGVRDIKVQEVYSLDEDMLAILPQPIHALIFLFRYKDTDSTPKAPSPPSHNSTAPDIWFANQVPDYACASVALLNIIYNIPNLHVGPELQDFHSLTAKLDPLDRGDAIDEFSFVKTIHNSFARENDLLAADYHLKQKVGRAKKRAATAKARETREAKKVAAAGVDAKPDAATKLDASVVERIEKKSVKRRAWSDASSSSLSDPPDSDPEFTASTLKPKRQSNRHSQPEGTDETPEIPEESVPELKRRLSRVPRPRQSFQADSPAPTDTKTNANSKSGTKERDNDNDEGFHFIAYMPIAGRIWKLDGLNHHPQDLGEIPVTPSTSTSKTNGHLDAESGTADWSSAGGERQDWMSLVAPALQERMHRYSDGGIEFNLMAVVHDPSTSEREALAANIKGLQHVASELKVLEAADTIPIGRSQEVEDADVADLLLGPSPELKITHQTIEAAHFVPISTSVSNDLTGIDTDPSEQASLKSPASLYTDSRNDLLKRHRELANEQSHLRAAVRDTLTAQKADEERALHRRHDYGTFVRSWLGALVSCEGEVLSQLLET